MLNTSELESVKITLTPAELELIRIKREEERLAEEKSKAEQQARNEKEIKNSEQQIEVEYQQGNRQVEATVNFYNNGFPAKDWILVKEFIKKSKTVEDYGEYPSVEVWTKEYEVPTAKIVSVERHPYGDGTRPAYTVSVNQWVTYGSSWSFRGINHGYRMQLTGIGVDYKYECKFLKRVKTLLDKINWVKSIENAKVKSKNDSQTNSQRLEKEIATKYPNATIEIGNYYSSYEKDTFSVVIVKFPNGITLKLKAYNEGYSIEEKTYPSGYDLDSYVNELSNMKMVLKAK